MEQIFFDLTLVLIVAAILATIFQAFKLPPLLGYITAGVILGPLQFFHFEDVEVFTGLSQIGIVLLLFLLGLESNLNELKSVGKVALIAGISQILLTSVLGYTLARVLQMPHQESIYIGLALAFSSTIIVVKSLSDKKDLQSLHGKIAVGILLVQDLAAIIALLVLAGGSAAENSADGKVFSLLPLLLILLKAVVLFAVIIFLSKYVFPGIVHYFSRSQELLYLVSLTWAFGFAYFVAHYLGFSIEIGGLVAGLALANSTKSYHIISKLKSLRDFFITIFFVVLGLELEFTNYKSIILPALVLILFVVIIKPLIVTFILGRLGFQRRVSFFAGNTLGQISEFSLILLFTGSTLGLVEQTTITLITVVAIAGFAFSTVSISQVGRIYSRIQKFLKVFELKNVRYNSKTFAEYKDHIIIVGAQNLGNEFFSKLKEHPRDVVVVDFDPDLIQKLEGMGISALYGDISDVDVQDKIALNDSAILFSTVSDTEDNLILLHSLANKEAKVKTVFINENSRDEHRLYKAGATMVLHPKTFISDAIGETLRTRDIHYFSNNQNTQ